MLPFINVARAGVISDAPTVSQIGMNILNFLLAVGGILAIIALVLASIKYFSAFGDKEAMTEAKKTMEAAIIGILMAMSGMIIVAWLGRILS